MNNIVLLNLVGQYCNIPQLLSVALMYVRGIQDTSPGIPDNISGRRVFCPYDIPGWIELC